MSIIYRLEKYFAHVCHTNIKDFAHMVQEDKFIELMKRKDYKIIAILGKYLHNSMTKRCGNNLWVQPTCTWKL